MQNIWWSKNEKETVWVENIRYSICLYILNDDDKNLENSSFTIEVENIREAYAEEDEEDFFDYSDYIPEKRIVSKWGWCKILRFLVMVADHCKWTVFITYTYVVYDITKNLLNVLVYVMTNIVLNLVNDGQNAVNLNGVKNLV